MAFEGWLNFGGGEIVNNERARGLSRSAECPMTWLKGAGCLTLADALGDAPYNAASMPDAPWYDLSNPDVSSRFFGVFALSVAGLNDSTRSASVVESIDDSATIGRTRKGSRQVRVRAMLLGHGRDALDYGVAWLNAALDPDACGQHDTGCGTSSLEFFTDCPPARRDVPSFTPWEPESVNLFTSPAFADSGARVNVRVNECRYPGDSPVAITTGWDGYRSAISNPGGFIRGVVNEVANPASSGLITNPSASHMTPAAPGDVWTGSAELRAAGGDRLVALAIQFYNASLTYIADTQVIGPSITGDQVAWKTARVTSAAAPAGTAWVRVNAYFVSAGAIGQVIDLRRATLEKSPVPIGEPFTGNQPPHLRGNLALNPAAVTGGASSWVSNDAALVPVARVSSFPVPHPLGISTGVESRSAAGASAALASMYNIDGLLNAGTPQRSLGVWVLVTEPGYQMTGAWATGVDLEPNVWTYVKTVAPIAAGAYAVTGLYSPTGNASTTARAYFTGLQVEPGAGPVGSVILPGIPTSPGFAMAWDGSANSAPSYLYDTDFSVAWEGAANSTRSILSGRVAEGVTVSMPAGGVALHSNRPGPGGSGSLRMMRIAPALNTYGRIQGATPPDSSTAIVSSFREKAVAPLETLFLWDSALGANRYPLTPTHPGPVGQWVEHRGSGSTVGWASLSYLLLRPPAEVGESVWYSLPGLFEGDYSDASFNGSTMSGELDRYSWTGDVNASTSLHETRLPTIAPQTDEEYQAAIEPYRRYLHGVAVTSGPYERELMNVGPFWAQIFEWTFTAESPWVFSATRPVSLPITPTVVIQDTPYNLVPYPSAELAGGNVTSAVNYSANPSVESNATGWLGSGAGSITGPMVTSGRVTGELSAVGASSFRSVFTATGAGTDGILQNDQEVNLSGRPANSRVSINVWSAELLMSGVAVRPDIEVLAIWRPSAGGASLRVDTLGTIPVNGGALSTRSIAPPAGANFVLVRIRARVTSWNASTVLRLYSDALAVTVP